MVNKTTLTIKHKLDKKQSKKHLLMVKTLAKTLKTYWSIESKGNYEIIIK